MGFWNNLLGTQAPPPPDPVPAAAPDPAPPSGAPTVQQRRDAVDHVKRFELAAAQCRVAIANGESSPGRLAELERWRDYYAALAALEGGPN